MDYSAVVAVSRKNKPGFISLYPNLVQDEVAFKLAAMPSANASIKILNVSGQVIRKQDARSKIEKINVSSLARGFYTLRYRDESRVESAVFVKQ